MYFMNICTWAPEDEKEVERRRLNWKWPKGVKVIFEFLDLQGCRTFNIIDTDAKGLVASRDLSGIPFWSQQGSPEEVVFHGVSPMMKKHIFPFRLKPALSFLSCLSGDLHIICASIPK
jgi:hypothetical protein